MLVRLSLLAGIIGLGAATPVRADDASTESYFENRVRPVLAGVCLRCHGAQKQSGGLRLDSRDALTKGGDSGPAIDAAEPRQSLILRAIRREKDVSAMPPDGALAADQKASLEAWVKAGAPWPQGSGRIATAKHWAFVPLRDVAPPGVRDHAWVRTSIDRFILARLEAAGRKPAKEADRRTLLRRVSYDLLGLPPGAEVVAAFERDASPGAFERTVDRLLASPHYGERWGRHWLDLVRYADTAGETADYPVPTAWRYRNYVIDAFNADKPYDQFVREQIAGDILARTGPREYYAERATATGFLAISRRFGFDSENYHHLTIQDTIDTLGQSVLGLSLGCARCHDHKFDPISMRDYYALYGIFDSSRYAFPGSEQKQQVRAMLPLVPPEESLLDWREFDERTGRLARQLERQGQGVPKAILRSLHELDGDFELQAPAAGGSNGVLVPPWLYQGRIAVTHEAQSPFTNLYARGRVGVDLREDAGLYRICQAIYPERTPKSCPRLHVSLDFRVAKNEAGVNAVHRCWIGARGSAPAVEMQISCDGVSVGTGKGRERIAAVEAGQWHQLEMTLDLENRIVSGRVAKPGHWNAFSMKPFDPGWAGRIDTIALEAVPIRGGDSVGKAKVKVAAIAFDNLAVRESPIPPLSSASDGLADARAQAVTARILGSGEATRASLDRALEQGPFPMTYGVWEGTPHDVAMQMRGEPDRPGEVVTRGFIKALGGEALPKATSGSGRLELARWLTGAENAIVARVMVNRIWQHHFGRGLVRTPNDFGARGELPADPALLDHLASEFVKSGWSIKALHRELILSSAYRQSSTGAGEGAVVAGGPKGGDLFSPFARRRLDAEELRDSILVKSGELDRTVARGHRFPSPLAWAYTQHSPFSAVYDHNKRSVYLMTQRIKRHPFLALFDGSDPNASTAARGMTTVPTQALYFLNDPFVHAKSEKCAAGIIARQPEGKGRIELAWKTVLERDPTDLERQAGMGFFDEYRRELAAAGSDQIELRTLAAYVRMLFASNEFLYLD